jgi:hypothetical protein
MMEEDKAIELGSYSQELMLDPRFNELVSLCESNLSLQMLDAKTAEERETVHRTYQGLKEIVSFMQQFVSVRDQIVLRREEEEKDK